MDCFYVRDGNVPLLVPPDTGLEGDSDVNGASRGDGTTDCRFIPSPNLRAQLRQRGIFGAIEMGMGSILGFALQSFGWKLLLRRGAPSSYM